MLAASKLKRCDNIIVSLPRIGEFIAAQVLTDGATIIDVKLLIEFDRHFPLPLLAQTGWNDNKHSLG